jgi:NAD(P)H-quinone oxidoreductase subunit 6
MEVLRSLTAGTVVFYMLATLTVASAVGVAFSRNILHSAFSLLGTLAGVAGLYFLLGADFVAVIQLLVYVGGILVLILFAVLLTREITDIRLSNLQVSLLAGVPAALLLTALIVRITIRAPFAVAPSSVAPTVHRIGDALLREYLLPFEIASVILLMALVGAMVIARRAVKEEVGASPDNPEVPPTSDAAAKNGDDPAEGSGEAAPPGAAAPHIGGAA